MRVNESCYGTSTTSVGIEEKHELAVLSHGSNCRERFLRLETGRHFNRHTLKNFDQDPFFTDSLQVHWIIPIASGCYQYLLKVAKSSQLFSVENKTVDSAMSKHFA